MAEMTRKRLDELRAAAKDADSAGSVTEPFIKIGAKLTLQQSVPDLIAAVEELVAALRETDSLMETVYDGMMPLSVATLGMKNEAILSRLEKTDE